jgi:diacylglycerol kinase family enzyme
VTPVRTAVVINPTSVTDVDSLRTRVGGALAAAGWPAPLWSETTVKDPGRGQTRAAIAAGARVVFACGGDGTIRACADQLAGTPVALAVLPVGTGNLFAANLGLPTDIEACIEMVVTGDRRIIDLGCSDGHHFTLMTGMGFDAAMMAATPASWKRWLGWRAYIVGGLRRLLDRPMRVQIALDGQPPIARTAKTVLVANMGRLQRGIDLFGGASPDDGLLDVAVVAPRELRDWLAVAVGLLAKRPFARPVETFRVSTVDITSASVEPRQIDGDPIEPANRLTATVRPRMLWVCVP